MSELLKCPEKEIFPERESEDKMSGDYTGPDGLLYCRKCGTKKEFRFFLNGEERVVPVLCECQEEKIRKEKEERDKRDRIYKISQTKNACIHDRSLIGCTFENDDGSLPQLESARRYVQTWPRRKACNNGLLLWGDVGTGKTFYAACIANALIERGVPVMMTNFAKILNRMSGMYSEDKIKLIADLMRYPLLILDDFGMERNTDYAMEQVFYVVDERYKTNLPLIITTNMNLADLKEPQDQAHQRVYDRVLAMCAPVFFHGESHRIRDRTRKHQECKEIFEGD